MPEQWNGSERTAAELRKILDYLDISTRQFAKDCGLTYRQCNRYLSGRYDGKMHKVVDFVLWTYNQNCPRNTKGSLKLDIPLDEWMNAPWTEYQPGPPRKPKSQKEEATQNQ